MYSQKIYQNDKLDITILPEGIRKKISKDEIGLIKFVYFIILISIKHIINICNLLLFDLNNNFLILLLNE